MSVCCICVIVHHYKQLCIIGYLGMVIHNNGKGTRYQLKNHIGKSAIPNDSEKNMNVPEYFMLLLVHAFVTAAAQVLQLEVQSELLKQVVNKIVEICESTKSLFSADHTDVDDMHLYATEVMLILHGIHDSIKKRDGDCIGSGKIPIYQLIHSLLSKTTHLANCTSCPSILCQTLFRCLIHETKPRVCTLVLFNLLVPLLLILGQYNFK